MGLIGGRFILEILSSYFRTFL